MTEENKATAAAPLAVPLKPYIPPAPAWRNGLAPPPLPPKDAVLRPPSPPGESSVKEQLESKVSTASLESCPKVGIVQEEASNGSRPVPSQSSSQASHAMTI